jgi:hypothetical protein
MIGERRRDNREEEKANIVVSGKDLKGHVFEEQTESINISASGILFYLNTFTGPRSFISIDLSQSEQFGYRGKVTAVEVRTERSSAEKHQVAAEFI